jgi:hypothetical protein
VWLSPMRATTFPENVVVSNWNYHALFPLNSSAIYNHLTEIVQRAPR